ncbi:2-oxo acid dehydrogenase subunit E2 [Thauera sp. Sel9]|uniref:2-oxo acid dehydrogenase subunit E2 n=1 Tax=Thauera sp. Sel9 TaxID=2974299 RepID=UPI0021E14900|nr:2-oxo acid dehydrogenase subunit E2 [Thauera sp. Sel9]MCV2218446.1 2-oxo acid dehydrogenase subunit E2 [Thauera sp. Sel9]
MDILVPQIGTSTEVVIIEIPVKVGDTIGADDTVLVLESDKATLDVPAGKAGTITALHVAVGDRVGEGHRMLALEANGETTAAPPAMPEPLAESPTPAPPPAMAAQSGTPAPSPAGTGEITDFPVSASPAIRKFARELGVDLGQIKGTGPRGRITREDVQAYVKAALSRGPVESRAEGFLGLPAWPQIDYAKFGEIERVPLSRITRISGPALTRNAIMIPHVTNFDEADVTDLEAFRKTANADDAPKITMLAFVVKAVASTLEAFPRFNSSLDGDHLILKKYINIGVAADTPDGLVVPVVRDCASKGLRTIAAEMAALAAAARTGKLKPQDMQGATFTISSLGGIGGTNFTPIINAPEVAILGMTRSSIKPVWDGQAFQPKLIQPMSLSWDHRVVDGVAAARFLQHLKTLLEDFRRVSV